MNPTKTPPELSRIDLLDPKLQYFPQEGAERNWETLEVFDEDLLE
jgi:hypothetical protein